jgi:hypothetical protein
MQTGTAETYKVFTRTWWAKDPAYPGGRRPCPGRKTTLANRCTLDEARRIAKQYNDTHNPGPLSRKAEIEQE